LGVTPQAVRRRPGGRSAEKRAAVLAATIELLAVHGPAGLSVGEVAKRAGVHETSIYRRWGTRERLALEAMAELSGSLLPVPDTGTLCEDLAAFGQELLEYDESPLGKALIRTMATNEDDEETAEVRTQFWDARYVECKIIIERAVKRHEIPASVDGRFLLEVFVAPIHTRALLTREPITAEFLQQLADVVTKGMSLAAQATEHRGQKLSVPGDTS
jgi:AcrR family transcriptional regulator